MTERRADLAGIHLVDRAALRRQQRSRGGLEGAILRTIQCGGVITPDRLARHSNIGAGECLCNEGLATIDHILWTCRQTDGLRARMKMRRPEEAAAALNALPLLGRQRKEQDNLADYAVQALRQWRLAYEEEERRYGDPGFPRIQEPEQDAVPIKW